MVKDVEGVSDKTNTLAGEVLRGQVLDILHSKKCLDGVCVAG
jgi:hypothetical protein